MSWWEKSEERILAAHAALQGTALLAPVGRDEAAHRLWQNHDIASFVEHRLGLDVDPLDLEEPLRSELIGRAAPDGLSARHDRYATRYWIRSGGENIGTIAVSLLPSGSSTLSVSSLYVQRQHRRRGHARRSLAAIDQAARHSGLSGIDLDTSWSWQSAVGLYLGLSMWVRMWKRDLKLVWHQDLPPWKLEVIGDEARFCVFPNEGRAACPLISARRDGNRLNWIEQKPPPELSEVGYEAPGTFALALATRGWPLITSDAAWQRQCDAGFSDCGGPEGLAFKIIRWEAWDRSQGYRVETPRIPGLEYRSWSELYPDADG